MDANNMYDLIDQNYGRFTKAERKVADYVLANANNILYTSISDLADLVGVADTTIFRFCRTLKLSGYQEFKMLLAQSSASQNSTNYVLGEKIELYDSVDCVKKKTLAQNIAVLNETCALLTDQMIEQAVEMIKTARNIYLFGIGSSGAVAYAVQCKFLRILPNVIYVFDLHMQTMSSTLLTPADLAIMFSYSGATKDMINIARNAKNNRCKSICVTRYPNSPLAAQCDVILPCGSNEGPLHGGSLGAKISQLFVLDVVCSEYIKRNDDQCTRNMEKTAGSISEKML